MISDFIRAASSSWLPASIVAWRRTSARAWTDHPGQKPRGDRSPIGKLSFDAQVHIINGFVGGEDGGTEWRKGHADEVVAAEDEAGLAIGRDADEPAAAVEAGSDVDVSIGGECEALRATEAAIPGTCCAVSVDGPDGVVGA